MDEIQQKAVDFAELKAGVQLQAGHKVLLLVNGAHGDPRFKDSGWAESDERSAPASTGSVDGGGEAATPPAGSLRNLRWGKSTPDDGEEVEMLADGPEGKTVLFTLERRGNEAAWQSMGSMKATVESGVARGTARVEHPGGLEEVHYRFRASLL